MYFKIAWRNLIKHKAFTAINILGLTLGITACLIIYVDTSFELSYDNFHPDKDRIYRVVSVFHKPGGENQYLSMVPDPMESTIKREFTGIEEVAQFHNLYATVNIPVAGKEPKRFDAAKDKEETSDIIITGPQYFNIFSYQWLAGNAPGLKQPFSVVLTESKAVKYFGGLQPGEMIGKKIIYDDSLQVTVIGIVKDYPANSDLVFKDFISASTIQSSFLKNDIDVTTWQNWARKSQTFVKLIKGNTPEQFSKQAGPVIDKYMDQGSYAKVTVGLQPLRDIHFNNAYPDTYVRSVSRPTLYSLMAIAVFILLIAAINFINLSTAQVFKRAREIGIRKVLGSSQLALISHLLAETGIIVFFSVIFSVAATPLLLFNLHGIIPAGAIFKLNAATIFFLLSLIVITTLLAGLFPAKLLSSLTPAATLKGKSLKKNNTGNHFRKGLIVFQFTLSLIFFISSIIINNQVNYVLTADMGFKKDAIINIYINKSHTATAIDALAKQVRLVKGVQLVSINAGTPLEKNNRATTIKCPAINSDGVESQFKTVDENYILLYGFKLIAGRNLLPCDTMKEYIINETCAKKLGFKNPLNAIGKTLHAGTTDGGDYYKEFPVVGIVADFHSQSFHEVIAPVFITTSKQLAKNISIKLSLPGQAQNMHETIAAISAAYKKVFPNENFSFSFFDETIAGFYEKEEHIGRMISGAMVMAIFIACLGLFSLATFTTNQRTKEIGVRKVLGANVSGIIGLLSVDFLKPVLLALVIASPLAYYLMYKWLQGFAYRTHISFITFLFAGASIIIIALITISYQTIKAAVANPVKTLRSE